METEYKPVKISIDEIKESLKLSVVERTKESIFSLLEMVKTASEIFKKNDVPIKVNFEFQENHPMVDAYREAYQKWNYNDYLDQEIPL